MADEPDTSASFKLMVDPDPKKDVLVLYIKYRNVYVRLQWRDAERDDVADLMQQKDPLWFLERGHLEYEVHRSSCEIDGDLSSLFSDDTEVVDEEVEDGE